MGAFIISFQFDNWDTFIKICFFSSVIRFSSHRAEQIPHSFHLFTNFLHNELAPSHHPKVTS